MKMNDLSTDGKMYRGGCSGSEMRTGLSRRNGGRWLGSFAYCETPYGCYLWLFHIGQPNASCDRSEDCGVGKGSSLQCCASGSTSGGVSCWPCWNVRRCKRASISRPGFRSDLALDDRLMQIMGPLRV